MLRVYSFQADQLVALPDRPADEAEQPIIWLDLSSRHPTKLSGWFGLWCSWLPRPRVHTSISSGAAGCKLKNKK